MIGIYLAIIYWQQYADGKFDDDEVSKSTNDKMTKKMNLMMLWHHLIQSLRKVMTNKISQAVCLAYFFVPIRMSKSIWICVSCSALAICAGVACHISGVICSNA